ncbi:MAG: (Na+)-NQR maturation NqrM [Pseudohongiellaceae bacterium]|jgi:hypothetical protein
MATLLVTFIVLALIVAMMSVGVLMGRKPVQGSCGGLNKIEGMGDCEICGGDRDRCDESGSQ